MRVSCFLGGSISKFIVFWDGLSRFSYLFVEILLCVCVCVCACACACVVHVHMSCVLLLSWKNSQTLGEDDRGTLLSNSLATVNDPSSRQQP